MGSPCGGAWQVDNGPHPPPPQQQQPAGGSVELAPPAPAAAAAATEARREQEPPPQLPEKRLRLARGAQAAAPAAAAVELAVAVEAHPGPPPAPLDASDMALDVRPGSGGVPGGVQNCDEIFSFPRNCLALPGGCGGVALPGSGGDAAAVQPPPTWQGSCSPA